MTNNSQIYVLYTEAQQNASINTQTTAIQGQQQLVQD